MLKTGSRQLGGLGIKCIPSSSSGLQPTKNRTLVVLHKQWALSQAVPQWASTVRLHPDIQQAYQGDGNHKQDYVKFATAIQFDFLMQLGTVIIGLNYEPLEPMTLLLSGGALR